MTKPNSKQIMINIRNQLELLKHEIVNIINTMALAKPLETEMTALKKQLELNLAKTSQILKEQKPELSKIKEISAAVGTIKAKLEKTKQRIEKQYMH